MRVPAGAVKVCAEKFSPAPVARVIRSLIPVFSPPVLGQTAYELPGMVVEGTHASAGVAVPRPASQDATVYVRAPACPDASAIQRSAQTNDAVHWRFQQTGDDMTLPYGSCY